MKAKQLSIYFSLLVSLLLAVTACQAEADTTSLPDEKTGTLTLQFELTPSSASRSGNDGVMDLYYEVQGDALMPCEPSAQGVPSRAGDGNPADGGGMVDLHVFLVDANDHIVARQYLYDMANVTTQSVTFTGLELGTYTAYAYANSEGNDWFTKPTYDVTSFTAYKDALLKRMDGTTPITVANGRMPLTGKSEITINYGNNTGSIDMIRPVGKLSVTLENKMDVALNPSQLSFGAIFPATGYVFPHDGIYTTENPYYALPNLDVDRTVLPNTSSLIYESLIYETKLSNAINVSMSYLSETVKEEVLYDGNLNKVGDNLIVNICGTNLYIGVSSDRKVIAVDVSRLDGSCIWNLEGNGNQNRALKNVSTGLYLNPNNGSLTTSSLTLRYGGNASGTTIYSSDYLKYSNNIFSGTTSNDATKFAFSSVASTGSEEVSVNQEVKEIVGGVIQALTTIYRNQHCSLENHFSIM